MIQDVSVRPLYRYEFMQRVGGHRLPSGQRPFYGQLLRWLCNFAEYDDPDTYYCHEATACGSIGLSSSGRRWS